MFCNRFILVKISKILIFLNFCNIKATNKKKVQENISKNNNIKNDDKLNKKENIKNLNNNKDSNIDIKNKNDNKKNNITDNDIVKSLERIKNNSKDKNNISNLDDLLFLDDDDEFKELFGDDAMFLQNTQMSFLNIPISFSYYLTLIDYNLKTITKDQRNNYFSKNIINVNSSIVVLYKFTTLHKKMWDSFLVKRPNNKGLIYIRDHFVPKLGIFFEKGRYGNYYSYKLKNKDDDNSKYKDIESTVKVPILRLGLALQFTWLKDESGMINSSIMLSGGLQTNYYTQGCCCLHCKDTNWVYISSDFYGVNQVGVNYYSKNINGFKFNPWYFMVHLEFGFYFIKLFTRFYSPISHSDGTNMSFLDLFKIDNCNVKDKKDNDIGADTAKKLNFDKWTMSWGISLSL